MTRRDLVKTLGTAPAILRARSRSKPNLLLLMSDQHRADWCGFAGNRFIHTPNLDRLAARGTVFDRAYSSTPSCTPARSALLTGKSPWGHGMLGYGRVAERYDVQLPELVRAAGYSTFGIGKMHWSPQRSLRGFEGTLLDESGRVESAEFRSDYRAWFASEAPGLDPDATGIGWNDYRSGVYKLPERLHPTRWTGDCAVRFIEEYQRPEPFFLKVSFARPHSPYDPPQRFWERYAAAEMPARKIGAWAEKYRPRSSDRADIWHGDVGEEEVRHSRIGYAGSISFMDEQAGRVIESLEKRHLLDETLILYLSDHGDMTGDHHMWRKSYPYEASAHIPMLLCGPGVRTTRSQTPVEVRDVLPTLVRAAGAAIPSGVDGQSLFQAGREWIDLEHDVCYSPSNHWNALTDGKTKYIYHAENGAEQLFDLARDAQETNDLAGDASREADLRLWRARLIEHLAPRGAAWVRQGRLVPRPQGQLYSPNYPGGALATKLGSSVF
jgi:arylsulfatase A-like enzyme